MPPVEVTPPIQQHFNRKKIIWGVLCLVGPTTLIIFSLLVFAAINFITGGNISDPIQTIINVILFLIGAVMSVAILPGIIVGIILLATSKK